jgi:CRISPR-associated endonuclease/helicase Cas3
MNITPQASFDDFFRVAFDGRDPFDYQRRLAHGEALPSLVNAPTGAGKTAAVIAAWLWRRFNRSMSVGRRLVYCLPMRTLVEQTKAVAEQAVGKLGLAERFSVYSLMGGDVRDDWDTQPERECVLIGTQDMLLSRALNRGYAMSRFRWPVHFGLLNNDCLWVFDEIQLMGDGLATTAQLAAFRERFQTFGKCHSLWMSATLDREWLRTIDFAPRVDELSVLQLDETDRATPSLSARLNAPKTIERAPSSCRTPQGLASFVKESHTRGTQTLIVVNRVARARETFAAIEEAYGLSPLRTKKGVPTRAHDPHAPELLLIHSRFRPHERRRWAALLGEKPDSGGNGRIIVATQVVEAGVDISSKLLVTDIAPYASLVQRFGRCNREGKYNDARVFWVDRPLTEKDAKLTEKDELDEKERKLVAAPYEWDDLETARGLLDTMKSAAPADLPTDLPTDASTYTPAHVLRRRDLIDLFDTTPDLSGYDLDISRFVRGSDERDVSVAWRDLQGEKPAADLPKLTRDELCPVPIGDEIRNFMSGNNAAGKSRQAWTWDALNRDWQKVNPNDLRPGMMLLFDIRAGGYDERRGWDAGSKTAIEDVSDVTAEKNEAVSDDPLTFHPKKDLKYLQTLAAHSHEARVAAEDIASALDDLALDEWRADLLYASHHHDWGKCHPIFQETLHKGTNVELTRVLAKSIGDARHARPYFRHELASALALLKNGAGDLAVYLAACHHGKVRLSIRALPGESKPKDGVGKLLDLKFARGIWDGERLPAVDLGDGVQEEETILDLEPMLLGAGEDGARSWLERMIALRDRLGVFRLAFLECLIRAADVRASKDPKDYWTEDEQ